MGCYKIQQEALAAEDKLVSISAFVNMIGKPSISHGTTRTLVEAMVCVTISSYSPRATNNFLLK